MMSTYDDDNDNEFTGPSGKRMIKSVLDIELLQRVFALSDETRAKLLAFLHLVEDPCLVKGDLVVDAKGDVLLKLFNQKDQHEDMQSEYGAFSEPLQ